MNDVVKIVVAGRRNAGKSTLANVLAGQEMSIVSPVPGTTTDPVRKRVEMPGIGICSIVDTAGLDDEGELGAKRIILSLKEMDSADIILAVGQLEDDILKKYGNKIINVDPPFVKEAVIAAIQLFLKNRKPSATVLEGLVSQGDTVVFVCPIDNGAPEGRLILPQVNAIRDSLDRRAVAVVLQPSELAMFLQKNKDVALVVTDSQVFREVSRIVPQDIPLTSFSMLLARMKGPFKKYVEGVTAIDGLKDGDRVLILESCAHHATCDDIGRVKLPALIRKHTGKNLEFEFVGGQDIVPRKAAEYSLVIQCGGCVVTARELESRIAPYIEAGTPVCNYGMAIAYVNGIFERVTKPLI